MNKATLKSKVTKALRKGMKGAAADIDNLIPRAYTAGKLYEAYVLALVCQRLKLDEGCTLTLVGSSKVTLKSSPGPLNTAYPHIRVEKGGMHLADIWTDVEFTSLSAFHSGKSGLIPGDYHEIDIAVLQPGAKARPLPPEILLAVECKNTGYQKRLLREILGVRRELSLLIHSLQPTAFAIWPRSLVPADPPSCIAVYSSDSAVLNFTGPGGFFGIDFFHEPL
jgi:hypothetical protein